MAVYEVLEIMKIRRFRNLILQENDNQNYTLLIFSINACYQYKRIL